MPHKWWDAFLSRPFNPMKGGEKMESKALKGFKKAIIMLIIAALLLMMVY